MTASAFEAGVALGNFDVLVLRQLQTLAEAHVKEALDEAGKTNRLLAASDPNQFIPAGAEQEFISLAYASWRTGLQLVDELAGDLIKLPFFDDLITAAVRRSSGTYLDILNTLIGKKAFSTLKEPIFGEFMKGNLVQYGDIRPLLVQLGGGSPDSLAPMMGGITTGRTMKDWLSQNGIDTNEKIWLYGYEDEPRRTFNGHLQMDGLVFESWEDEGLRIAPQDAWLRRTHYQPGDHWGCACVVAPFIPNFGEEYQISI